MKNVLKYKLEDYEGFLSVYEEQNTFYAIVKKDAPKVSSIESTHQLLVSYEIKNPTYQTVYASVSYEADLVKMVFEKLAEQKNLYFKVLDETLCVVKISKTE